MSMNTLDIVGKSGDTFAETSTNTAQNLDNGTSLAFKNSDGKLLTALFLQVQTNDLRFCYGSTPVQGGLGMTLYEGQNIYLRNPANIRSFKYISNVADAHAELMITPFYGNF